MLNLFIQKKAVSILILNLSTLQKKAAEVAKVKQKAPGFGRPRKESSQQQSSQANTSVFKTDEKHKKMLKRIDNGSTKKTWAQVVQSKK